MTSLREAEELDRRLGLGLMPTIQVKAEGPDLAGPSRPGAEYKSPSGGGREQTWPLCSWAGRPCPFLASFKQATVTVPRGWPRTGALRQLAARSTRHHDERGLCS
jgi:hypothetical protein